MTFSDRRLALAQQLASLHGRTWTGLTTEQRDALMDAADTAVRQAADALDGITTTRVA